MRQHKRTGKERILSGHPGIPFLPHHHHSNALPGQPRPPSDKHSWSPAGLDERWRCSEPCRTVQIKFGNFLYKSRWHLTRRLLGSLGQTCLTLLILHLGQALATSGQAAAQLSPRGPCSGFSNSPSGSSSGLVQLPQLSRCWAEQANSQPMQNTGTETQLVPVKVRLLDQDSEPFHVEDFTKV